MGKTRDLFKKIRDIRGTFHVKMGTIKDRNYMCLIGAEDIKKRWQEYTEKLYIKDLNDPNNQSEWSPSKKKKKKKKTNNKCWRRYMEKRYPPALFVGI